MTHTLPPGWEEKKLEDIVSVLNGLWTGKKPPYCQAFVIRNTNFTKDCRLDLSDVANLQVEQRQFDNRELKKGDILVEKSGGGPKQPVGRVVLFDKTERGFSFSNFTSVLRIKNPTIISYYFLYWLLYFCYLSGKTIPMQKYTTGIRNLQMSEYKELKVSFPSLVEQKRIVEKLDKIFAAIDKAKSQTEKNLQNAQDVFTGLLNHIMCKLEKYHTSKLIEIYKFIDYRGVTPTKLTSGIPLITAKNVKKGFLDYSIREFISEQEYRTRQTRGVSHKGDLLFTTEAPLGNVAIADLECFSAGQRLITLQKYPSTCDKIFNKFYYYFILSDWFQSLLKQLATGTTAQGIKASILKEIKVPVPPLPIQHNIVSKLQAVHLGAQKLEKIYTQKLADLEELKQAVLQQAFSGKL